MIIACSGGWLSGLVESVMHNTWYQACDVATAAVPVDRAQMKPVDFTKPFVLLDDARPNGAGPIRLFRDLESDIIARTAGEVTAAFDQMRAALGQGRHLAGYLSYDLGRDFEPRLAQAASESSIDQPPLLWLGRFRTIEIVDPQDLPALLGDPAAAWVGSPKPRIAKEDYCAAVGKILELIGAGDIYQANFTFQADVPFAGSPPALYARLRRTSDAGWGGLLYDGERWLLSCSPELFFTLSGGQLTARPMKGTVPVSLDPATLRDDIKQRAENMMIVDLIRNDLSRVAKAGTVAVPALFAVESFPTVHQMTSTVTAELEEKLSAIDVIETIFPSGSVTGAPKIRAMEIIAELEQEPRGAYTGAIGWIDPNGDAAFNVAIRTLMIRPDSQKAVMGLGSGIVADSSPGDEWRECIAKGAFVTAATPRFDLVETMRFDAHEGLLELERHLARLKASAERFGFAFDRHALRNELQAATFRLRDDRRVRLRLSPTGAVALEVRKIAATPNVAEVLLVPRPVARDDYRLSHKTSDRGFYDDARAAAGTFEVIFIDDDGFVTEGSFTNVFVERKDVIVTPPLARGLLPGVLREKLIEEGRAIEDDITPAELTGVFFIGNALRGLIPARLVAGSNPAGL